ncbi:MAG: AmmeMemoRadiSam system protein A [Candidatus Aminicenantes bacterium]|nr:AmmeMemoRadiSam system protein A [Candidatus Aminicenantes bacterium]
MSEFLTDSQKRFLLGLARTAVETYLGSGETISPETGDEALLADRGAFVTLKAGGELRGCIGYPIPTKPLAETVVEMAIAAATQDFRFAPLRAEELERLEIEISVLTVPRPAKDASEVEVGRHGIIVSKDFQRGLLLPQVPAEYGWDRETFLRHGCLKAGLPADAWRKGAAIEVFEAQVFSEADFAS